MEVFPAPFPPVTRIDVTDKVWSEQSSGSSGKTNRLVLS